LILKLKKDLETEGFETSWQDPFFAWMHPEDAKMKEPQSEPKNTFYICDLPIPKIVPFDLATISITVDKQINFQLSLYYIKILEDEVDGDAINNVFDRHATEWSVKRTDYFANISSRFSLLWDTEYDAHIEDCLYGKFPVTSSEKIIAMVNDMQELYLKNVFGRVKQQYENAAEKLKDEMPDVAKQLTDLKYSIFYTNPLNTLKNGPIYYLGFNPGGSIENSIYFKDYEENLECFKKKKRNWCEFIDETWPPHKEAGNAPLQRRVKSILEIILKELKIDQGISDIFCTNLYFFRSPNARKLPKHELLNCWKYHEEFLKIIRPKIVVCNGNGKNISAYTVFRKYFDSLGKNDIKELDPLKIYGKYSIKSFTIENSFWGIPRVLVLGVPHLSRFSPEAKITECTQYIKKKIETLDLWN